MLEYPCPGCNPPLTRRLLEIGTSSPATLKGRSRTKQPDKYRFLVDRKCPTMYTHLPPYQEHLVKQSIKMGKNGHLTSAATFRW
ncbi:hypothetical protein ATANTOWER_004170 [Ataeniobius toweri]|uniref:Uncharacterized protein n=1 Tax=Ataeniobius toweri TaxID=208326 RepID=A0ABU7AEW8_9TELE|nr:hypothetical protein [Ataeniobius toweri]